MIAKLISLLVFICCLNFGYSNFYTGTWTSTNNTMSSAREQCAVVMLNNGKVLVCGGNTNAINSSATDTCDSYDPSTNTFTYIGTMNSQRGCPAYGLLNDGRVYLGGGSTDLYNAIATAEIFDPTDNSFTIVSNLTYAMYCPTTYVLTNGLVLIAGGVDNNFNYVLTPILYDATNDSYIPTGLIVGDKFMGVPVWLPNEMLAVIGFGIDVYDPKSNSWTQPQNQPPEYEAGTSAFLLSNGKVVLFGGWDGGDALTNITIWDPINDNYTTNLGFLQADTSFNAGILLPNDVVVLAGGLPNITGSEIYGTNAAEIWQLGAIGSRSIAPMKYNRAYTNGIAIGSNKMLVIGGADETGLATNTAEVVTISAAVTTGVPAGTTGAHTTSSKASTSTSTSTSSSSSKGTSGSTSTTSSKTSSASHLQICASLLFVISLFLM